MTNYAEIESKLVHCKDIVDFTFLSSYGVTEDTLSAEFGRYVRGKNKGKLKGAVRIEKAIRGGWVRDSSQLDRGYVVRPNEIVKIVLLELKYSPDFGYCPVFKRSILG